MFVLSQMLCYNKSHHANQAHRVVMQPVYSMRYLLHDMRNYDRVEGTGMYSQPDDTLPEKDRDELASTQPLQLEFEEAPAPSMRRTKFRIIELCVLLLLVIFLLSLIAQYVSSNAKQITLGQSSGLLVTAVIVGNVDYGSVTLNGHLLHGSLPLIATLSSKSNDVMLNAPPFHVLRCRFQWPVSNVSGACTLRRLRTTSVRDNQQTSPELAIEFQLSGSDLSLSQYDGAVRTTQHLLEAVKFTSTVPQGQYIALGSDSSGHILSQSVTVPLQARLSFGLAAIDAAGGGKGCNTVGLCSGPPFAEITNRSTPHHWRVSTAASLHWLFSGKNGLQLVSPGYSVAPVTLVLVYDEISHGWQPEASGASVRESLSPLICEAAFPLLAPIFQQYHAGSSILHDHGLEGCEIQLVTEKGENVGIFAFRFGVVLDVDASAQTVAPMFPVAPQAEIDVIRGS